MSTQSQPVKEKKEQIQKSSTGVFQKSQIKRYKSSGRQFNADF